MPKLISCLPPFPLFPFWRLLVHKFLVYSQPPSGNQPPPGVNSKMLLPPVFGGEFQRSSIDGPTVAAPQRKHTAIQMAAKAASSTVRRAVAAVSCSSSSLPSVASGAPAASAAPARKETARERRFRENRSPESARARRRRKAAARAAVPPHPPSSSCATNDASAVPTAPHAPSPSPRLPTPPPPSRDPVRCPGALDVLSPLRGPDLASAFVERGFLELSSVVAPEYCDRLCARLERVLRGEYDTGVAPDKAPKRVKPGNDRLLGWSGNRNAQGRCRSSTCGRPIEPLPISFSRRRSDRLLRRLAGKRSHGARAWRRTRFGPSRPAQAPRLHRDSPYFDMEPEDVVTVWITLTISRSPPPPIRRPWGPSSTASVRTDGGRGARAPQPVLPERAAAPPGLGGAVRGH